MITSLDARIHRQSSLRTIRRIIVGNPITILTFNSTEVVETSNYVTVCNYVFYFYVKRKTCYRINSTFFYFENL